MSSKFGSSVIPVEKEHKSNVGKTFRRRPGLLLNVLCTFNLRPVFTGKPTNCDVIFDFPNFTWFRAFQFKFGNSPYKNLASPFRRILFVVMHQFLQDKKLIFTEKVLSKTGMGTGKNIFWNWTCSSIFAPIFNFPLPSWKFIR